MALDLAYQPHEVEQLVGRSLPSTPLSCTDGSQVDLTELKGWIVIYAYPRTSPANEAPIPGWADIPGAKGCTPQSCGFRDAHADLKAAGAAHVFGLSTQSSDYQREVVARLHLPFDLLSDEAFVLQNHLNLPVFSAGGMTLLHRVTLVAKDGVIEKVFHTIDAPAQNAADVLDYLRGV